MPASVFWPRSSIPSLGIIISASKDISLAYLSPIRWKRLHISADLAPSARTDKAALTSVSLVRALRNLIASNRLDLPAPFAPATQVNGPKRTSTSTRFLKPDTFKRVNITIFQSISTKARHPSFAGLHFFRKSMYCRNWKFEI